MKKNDRPDEIQTKVSELELKVAELNDRYLRALADYQNLSKQTEEWKSEFVQYANSDLVKKLLEILDDLEKAQETLQNEGLGLIVAKFERTLEEAGVSTLELEGKEFDPALAEVVSTEPAHNSHTESEKKDIIVKVLQKGYKLKDRVIRPAKVVVGTYG